MLRHFKIYASASSLKGNGMEAQVLSKLHYLVLSFLNSEYNHMGRYILALDQGTTSSRAIVFNNSGLPVAIARKEFTQHFPEPGWVEHNPDEIWSTQADVANGAIA